MKQRLRPWLDARIAPYVRPRPLIVREALRFLAAEVDARIDGIRSTLDERGATPAVLAELIAQGLADAHALEADRAVVTAAVNDPQLRELARRWSQQMAGFLVADYGVRRATAAAIFIDGVFWHSRINDEPPSEADLESTLADILGTTTT